MRAMPSRKPIPSKKPTAAGMTDENPPSGVISMAGMSSDHTAAAIITPEAKPSKAFWRRGGIWSLMRKTNADPTMVPAIGISRVSKISWFCKRFI